jgi:hypothetical protein
MVSHMFYCEFITSFHIHYNGAFLRPFSWCHKPIERNDDYIEFINRKARNYIDTTFLAKYDFDNKQILIKCEYNYFQHYIEKSEVDFILKGHKDNTYNYKNSHGEMVNHLADEEILTFIKMFDQFYLEEKDIPLSKDEYNMYVRHLKNNPDLIADYTSNICDYNIIFYYNECEKNISVKFFLHNKIDKCNDTMEYQLFKNRMVGDDFSDITTKINNIIASRMDLINIDYMEFVAFRL